MDGDFIWLVSRVNLKSRYLSDEQNSSATASPRLQIPPVHPDEAGKFTDYLAYEPQRSGLTVDLSTLQPRLLTGREKNHFLKRNKLYKTTAVSN